jgi:hypothetical protein
MPDLPDAGDSSAHIAGAFAAIARASSGIVRSAAVAAARVHAADESYRNTDHSGSESFGGQR